jgi:dolichol-phosphate mannosyltransferase
MKKLIIVPTLNERKNILNLYNKINKTNMNFDILFIDDNSIDGSQEIIKKLAKKSKKIKYIFRPKKMGIGSAHKDAFKWAYKKKYQILISIDADGTHDPKFIKLFINKLKNHDIVISNRFMKPNLLQDWPLVRIWLTFVRHLAIRILLSIPYDSSGAFRCINCKKVSLSDLILAKDNGYSYFWESIFILHQKKYKIIQLPVPLPFRQVGKSKISFKDIFFAIYYLFLVFFKKIYGKYNFKV